MEKKYYSKVVRLISQNILTDWNEPYKIESNNSSVCTGFFIDNKGSILTCSHCVEDSSSVYFEIPTLGRDKYKAEIIFICPKYDIALLRAIDYKNKDYFKLADYNYIYKINSGLKVHALGFPLGKNNLKITEGVISGRDNSNIQTTSALNPGNSGGPLLYKDKVIGVNSSVVLHASNIGFASPISYYHLIYKNKLDNKLIRIPKLGLQTCNLNKSFFELNNYKNKEGIYITNITKNSLADLNGIMKGDILLSINGISVDNNGLFNKRWFNEKMNLADIANTFRIDETLNIELLRNCKTIKKKFKYELKDVYFKKRYPLFEKLNNTYSVFGGLVVSEINLNNLHELMMRSTSSIIFKQDINSEWLKIISHSSKKHDNCNFLLITHIFPNSEIANNDILKVGDVITSMNEVMITNNSEYKKAVCKYLTNDKNEKYLRFETNNNKISIHKLHDILNEEEESHKLYKYNLSDIYTNLMNADKSTKLKSKKNQKSKYINQKSKHTKNSKSESMKVIHLK